MGLVKAPSLAMSQTANLAHVHAGAFTFHLYSCCSNSRVFSRSSTSLCIVVPSPHTTSAIRNGNVEEMSAVTDKLSAPAGLTENDGRSTSPVEIKPWPFA